ncbi:MAG: methyl-accepting chemotaxis protein [Spirochaetaceae bacterium]|nr:methyl-accepting chemotaxis protein [Spirochaetaceae bacterium]
MKAGKIILSIASIVMVSVFMVIGSHMIFSRDTHTHLESVAYTKLLELDNDMEPELTLAMQMVRSPVMIEYMENPSDPEKVARAMKEFQVFQSEFASHRTFWISDIDKKYYSNMEYLYTLDPTREDSAWYPMTLNSGDEYQFYVDFEVAFQKTFLWINALVYNQNKKPIGIAGTGIELSDFVDSMYSKLESGVDMLMYNMNGEISGSTNLDDLEKKTQITVRMPELAAVSDLFPKTNTRLSTWKGEYLITPLNQVGWMMVLFKPYTFREFILNAAAPFAVIMIILVIVLIITALSNILRPLNEISSAVKGISSGDADLRKRIDTKFHTAFKVIPAIVRGFNAFLENLNQIISVMKQSKASLETAGTKLSQGTQETMDSINLIISNIKGFGENLERQNLSVDQTASTVEQILSNIKSLETMVITQAQVVENASGAVGQMIHNIGEVNTSVDRMAQSFGVLANVADSGAKTQTELQGHIAEIETQSKLLNEANTVIANIASQTNLLAMNAAIEAAHAGNAGKGFAVVADEIRKLSETSTRQSKTIGEQLNAIQSKIETVVTATQEGVSGYKNLAKEISETDSLVRQIKSAMEEQQAGSAQITHALKDMNESSKKVQSAAQEMNEGSKTIMTEMNTLQEETHNMKEEMDEMARSASKINESGAALSEISNLMEKSISEIGQQVDQFKV